mmetsp:Transcript_16436/g.27873  ORF Transcript_16436/g.27873 Transcript_16436/m.27873 type:complete len:183 (-) Transcript_16436:1618-2166(-)
MKTSTKHSDPQKHSKLSKDERALEKSERGKEPKNLRDILDRIPDPDSNQISAEKGGKTSSSSLDKQKKIEEIIQTIKSKRTEGGETTSTTAVPSNGARDDRRKREGDKEAQRHVERRHEGSTVEHSRKNVDRGDDRKRREEESERLRRDRRERSGDSGHRRWKRSPERHKSHRDHHSKTESN